jgi:hypothetical protein
MTTSTPGNVNDGMIAAVVLPLVEEGVNDINKLYNSEVDDTLVPVA